MLELSLGCWIKLKEPVENNYTTVSRYYLSQHPDVEAKVIAELDACELLVTPARPQPRTPEYDDLPRLNYLKCVIKVALPFYSLSEIASAICNKLDSHAT